MRQYSEESVATHQQQILHAAEKEELYKVLSLARSLRVINRNQLVRLLPLQRLGYVVLFHERFLREQISHQCFY